MEVDFQDILQALGPGEGQNVVWSIFLYVIFGFALLTLLLTPDKNMVPTLLIAGVLLAAIIAKLSLGIEPPLIERKDFGMMLINIVMFVFPLIAVGMARARKNKMAAPAMITSLIGGAYFFMFWVVVQRA
ncbi:MAG: hypothetical protein SGJ24_02325 [Chloroflexota bacterium]|nr:hypothetical protein [Chloroflexota bacterium]